GGRAVRSDPSGESQRTHFVLHGNRRMNDASSSDASAARRRPCGRSHRGRVQQHRSEDTGWLVPFGFGRRNVPGQRDPRKRHGPRGERGRGRRTKRRSAMVALPPSATETLHAAGAAAQVKAGDTTPTSPPQAPRTKLSYFNPNVEAIAAERPDLVVISNDSN